jgi:hypothetical protein
MKETPQTEETAFPEGKTLPGQVQPPAPAFTAPGDPKKPFEIIDEQTATWYARKLKGIHDEREAIKAATLARIAELDADERSLRARFDQQLESWAMGESERRRRKTITLPLAGVALKFRALAGRLIEAKDGGTVRAELAQTLGFMTPPTAPAPDVKRYAAHARAQFEEHGEILPGFEFTEPRQSFIVDLAPSKGKETDAQE